MTPSVDSHPLNKPVNIYKRLRRRIQALKQRQKDRHLSARVTKKNIAAILEDVERKLSGVSPFFAWELTDILLRSDSELLYTVDDSRGVLGSALSQLPDAWIRYALHAEKDTLFWRARIELLLDVDEFGHRTEVLEKSEPLLGNEVLQQMAERFSGLVEKEKAAITDEEFFTDRRPMHRAARLLKCCAVALQDPYLYEDAIRREFEREPERMHLIECAEMFIRFGKNEEAKKRLLNVNESYLQPVRDALLATVRRNMNEYIRNSHQKSARSPQA